MFYCKYCRTERDDILAGIEYKRSIKCYICVRRGTKLTDSRVQCPCGVSYINTVTTEVAHLKSKIHLHYVKELFS